MPTIPLTAPFRRRGAQPSESDSASHSRNSLSISSSKRRAFAERELPFLWPWAADANRSKLRGITLAHVLSGDTVSPISLSDFEAFLAFCDISLENLQFIVWFQDYRARFDALPYEQKVLSAPPRSLSFDKFRSRNKHSASNANVSASTFRSSESGSTEDRDDVKPDLRVHLANSSVDFSPRDRNSENNSVSGNRYLLSSPMKVAYPRSQDGSNPVLPDVQPFRTEIQNILATFFVPDAKKELSLTSDMRERVIKESAQTTHPDVFFSVYEAIYETVECVSLPRFLENASTNINRPRQLFWYFSALPTFLLGVAITLLFVLSHSENFVVPPQSHRAWRLFSVPCFFLSSMMWYKGFRGFCPFLFLRSCRQLRPWELEHMADDEEAQAYCISLSTKGLGSKPANVDGLPPTPISPNSASRIAPFLNSADTDTKKKEDGIEGGTLATSVSRSNSARISQERDVTNVQFRSRARNGYHRPPIFGPGRVVEDERIRSVHMHLLWSLVRFGLFWAAVSAAIVVSVPSAH